MRRTIGCGVLLAGLALAGCGEGTSESPSGVPAPPSPVTAPASATPPGSVPSGVETPGPASPAGGVLIEFERQGGLAGVVDRLEVRGDGGFTLVRGRPAVNRSGRVTPAELSDLNRKIDASGFATLPGVENATGSDLFVYHLTYGGRQVLAQDGGIAAPLQPVVDALSGMVQKYGS